jgi:putative endonuclease
MGTKSALNSAKGRYAESLVCTSLLQQGWTILTRNQYFVGGELDIIARDPQKVLVFVEVKSSWKQSAGRPQAQVHRKKQVYLWKAASAWISLHQIPDQPMRFDVISLCFHNGTCTWDHIRDAFCGPSATY